MKQAACRILCLLVLPSISNCTPFVSLNKRQTPDFGGDTQLAPRDNYTIAGPESTADGVDLNKCHYAPPAAILIAYTVKESLWQTEVCSLYSANPSTWTRIQGTTC